MTAVLQDQPLPARLAPWKAADPQSLAHCVLLAVLLHLWLVLMLGTAPGGTAQPGQGVYGAINITLRGPVSTTASDSLPAATPVPGLSPDSAAARWGGRVRQTEKTPDSLPGAERLGVPAPQAPVALPVPAPQALPMSTPAPQAPTMPAPQAPPTPSPSAPPAPTPPEPAPAPQERSLSALPPAARVDAPALAREPTAALAGPAELQALPTPGAAPAALKQLQPAAIPAAPRAAEAAEAAEAALARPVPAEAVSLPSAPDLAALPTPGTRLQLPGSAGPDAGSRVGHDVATPAAATASQPPRLNLELARPRGGELSRFATGGALPVLPRPPEVDDKLARDIEKAGKADCRKAYAGAGLLAVAPLVADALRGQGCKW